MTKRLEGKVALITGAGTGVGRACMMRFAQEGAKILGAGRTSATLEAVVAEVEAGKGEARMAVGDLSRAADVERVVDEVKDAYGRIDILVHAAGVGYSWAEKSPGSMNGTIDLSPEKMARGDRDQSRQLLPAGACGAAWNGGAEKAAQ